MSKESKLFVPRYNVWGVNNRAAAYRVCYARAAPSSTRLENRIPCSSASLTSCLYATFASILNGWNSNIFKDVYESRLFGYADPLNNLHSYEAL
jgi:glutamine synthetase